MPRLRGRLKIEGAVEWRNISSEVPSFSLLLPLFLSLSLSVPHLPSKVQYAWSGPFKAALLLLAMLDAQSVRDVMSDLLFL